VRDSVGAAAAASAVAAVAVAIAAAATVAAEEIAQFLGRDDGCSVGLAKALQIGLGSIGGGTQERTGRSVGRRGSLGLQGLQQGYITRAEHAAQEVDVSVKGREVLD